MLDTYTAVYWDYNGERLSDGSPSHQIFHGPNHVVFWYNLNNVTVKDSGNYTCGVQTHEGHDQQIIELHVEKNGNMNAIPF